ncbi:hypothetical protein ACFFQF_08570 [Haladaptatus pallidirubidus]|uniref:DUF8052 domain-containing protein n=1 Tax=Haladaptatus pallidirubidus TaxID=1008152 RepID=A0AAV3UGG4_9EURY|nr:hypothetical protein [Haladaptatus pallidirubidus]
MDGGIESHDSARTHDSSEITDELDVPDWDDEYVDRVSDRLFVNYDLKKSHSVRGKQFTLYGQLLMENRKHFFHESLNYANHASVEHLFVRRTDSVRIADLETLGEFGHELADEWIEADEEHFGTDFTFVVIVPEIPDEVREFVSGFRDRTLLKYGYYGRYEINLVVVAPDREDIVASANADVGQAFVLWQRIEPQKSGLFSRIVRRFR